MPVNIIISHVNAPTNDVRRGVIVGASPFIQWDFIASPHAHPTHLFAMTFGRRCVIHPARRFAAMTSLALRHCKRASERSGGDAGDNSQPAKRALFVVGRITSRSHTIQVQFAKWRFKFTVIAWVSLRTKWEYVSEAIPATTRRVVKERLSRHTITGFLPVRNDVWVLRHCERASERSAWGDAVSEAISQLHRARFVGGD